jgi:hypothetical protein
VWTALLGQHANSSTEFVVVQAFFVLLAALARSGVVGVVFTIRLTTYPSHSFLVVLCAHEVGVFCLVIMFVVREHFDIRS